MAKKFVMKNPKKGPAKTAPKQSVSKRATDALERIGALESGFIRLVQGTQEALGQQSQQFGGALAQMADGFEALCNLLGRDRVNTAIEDLKKKRLEEQVAQAKTALENMIANGSAVPSTSIGENSVLVGREFDKDGVVIHPGRTQLQFAYVKSEFREGLVGKGPGTKIKTVNDVTFEVTEVYDVVPKEEKAASEQTIEAEASAHEVPTLQ